MRIIDDDDDNNNHFRSDLSPYLNLVLIHIKFKN